MENEKVRVDKWLWSVRIYKSRSQASDACRSNQVKVNSELSKPSGLVSVGDQIDVKKGGFKLTFRVLQLLDKRVGAPIAQECYEDLTPDEERNKFKDWFIGKGRPEIRQKGTGRPTKKNRRTLDTFKGGDQE